MIFHLILWHGRRFSMQGLGSGGIRGWFGWAHALGQARAKGNLAEVHSSCIAMNSSGWLCQEGHQRHAGSLPPPCCSCQPARQILRVVGEEAASERHTVKLKVRGVCPPSPPQELVQAGTPVVLPPPEGLQLLLPPPGPSTRRFEPCCGKMPQRGQGWLAGTGCSHCFLSQPKPRQVSSEASDFSTACSNWQHRKTQIVLEAEKCHSCDVRGFSVAL